MTIPNGDGQPSAQAAGPLSETLCLAVDVASFYTMRASVAAHASQWGLTEPQLNNLLVVATELTTNTVRHAGGAGTLRLWRDGNVIRCQAEDDGPGIVDPEHAGVGPVALTSNDGRGLWLVRQLSDELTITNRNPGCTVTATIAVSDITPHEQLSAPWTGGEPGERNP